MRRILILSPHRPSRELLSRLLAQPDLSVVAMADADELLEALADEEPALVVVDARRPDEDAPLMLGLLKRRYPRQPLITLVPGRLRVFDGGEERVREVHDGSAEALHFLLAELQRATRDLLAQHLLRVLRPPIGEA
ncbi:DNA-binding response regulator [Archangium primigenium]|uniref:DNA-binding response regulator n=1 Tax=[Archangium] primigenium TaxID=2792470 RepID=UPI001959B2AE|nr:DNA-binding response regulator [Archangium primigenium]MBM7113731.1 DNA-binding response regulator [Archangium primigenium]